MFFTFTHKPTVRHARGCLCPKITRVDFEPSPSGAPGSFLMLADCLACGGSVAGHGQFSGIYPASQGAGVIEIRRLSAPLVQRPGAAR